MNEVVNKKEHVFQKEIIPQMDALYSFGYWLTHNEEEAKDLVQESMLKAYRYLDYYEEGTNAKSWLFRIAKNNFLNDQLKSKRTPDLVDVEDVRVKVGTEFEKYQVHSYDFGLSDEVVGALNCLPSNLKTVFLLKYLNDFKYHEIAEMFDIPMGTVKIWLHRAKNMMKTNIGNYKSVA